MLRFEGCTCGKSTLFESNYRRNNKSAGVKNVRCFPHCCANQHNPRGFCGNAVRVRLHNVSSLSYHVYACFETDESSRKWAANDIIPKTVFEDNSRDSSKPLLKYMRGVPIEKKCNKNKDDKYSSQLFGINVKKRSWHYGWTGFTSGKLQEDHHFVVYLVSSKDEHDYIVEDIIRSPVFQIVSSRRCRQIAEKMSNGNLLLEANIPIPTSDYARGNSYKKIKLEVAVNNTHEVKNLMAKVDKNILLDENMEDELPAAYSFWEAELFKVAQSLALLLKLIASFCDEKRIVGDEVWQKKVEILFSIEDHLMLPICLDTLRKFMKNNQSAITKEPLLKKAYGDFLNLFYDEIGRFLNCQGQTLSDVLDFFYNNESNYSLRQQLDPQPVEFLSFPFVTLKSNNDDQYAMTGFLYFISQMRQALICSLEYPTISSTFEKPTNFASNHPWICPKSKFAYDIVPLTGTWIKDSTSTGNTSSGRNFQDGMNPSHDWLFWKLLGIGLKQIHIQFDGVTYKIRSEYSLLENTWAVLHCDNEPHFNPVTSFGTTNMVVNGRGHYIATLDENLQCPVFDVFYFYFEERKNGKPSFLKRMKYHRTYTMEDADTCNFGSVNYYAMNDQELKITKKQFLGMTCAQRCSQPAKWKKAYSTSILYRRKKSGVPTKK